MTKPTRRDRFLSLLEEHAGILRKVAGAYGQGTADREDLAQEIVLQLWRSFGRYDERRPFPTWMYRVALNTAISFHRGAVRRGRDTVTAGDAVHEIAAPEQETAAREYELQLLQRFVDQLDELDKALVILHLDGNRHDTIAEVLGISVSNVGTKISRIKQRLRREWAEHSKLEQGTWNSTT